MHGRMRGEPVATDMYEDRREQLRKAIIGLRERWAEIDGALRAPNTADSECEKLRGERKRIRQVIDEVQDELRRFPPDPDTARA